MAITDAYESAHVPMDASREQRPELVALAQAIISTILDLTDDIKVAEDAVRIVARVISFRIKQRRMKDELQGRTALHAG